MSLFGESLLRVQFTGDVQRLSLKPGDKVVVTFPCDLSHEQAALIKDALAGRFEGNEVLVLGNGAEVSVLEKAA